jgi:hypothetical protein
MINPSQHAGILAQIRNVIPVSNYDADVQIASININKGKVFRSIVGKLPCSEATVEGQVLVVKDLHRSLKLGLLDIGRFRNGPLDIDRRILDVVGRFTVTQSGGLTTITVEIHQGWTTFVDYLILFPAIGWAYLVNVLFRTKVFANRSVRAAVQQLLNDLKGEIEHGDKQDKLTSAFDSLT